MILPGIDIRLTTGIKIKFLRELYEPPCEEHPGILFATKDSYGIIECVGGCKEGFWVFWDSFPNASFGCSSEDFEVIND